MTEILVKGIVKHSTLEGGFYYIEVSSWQVYATSSTPTSTPAETPTPTATPTQTPTPTPTINPSPVPTSSPVTSAVDTYLLPGIIAINAAIAIVGACNSFDAKKTTIKNPTTLFLFFYHRTRYWLKGLWRIIILTLREFVFPLFSP